MVTLDVNPFGTNDVQYDAEFESFNELKESSWHDIMAAPAFISPKNAVFHCDKCTYESHSQELFDRHVTRHLTDRPFECTLCDYSVLDHSRFVHHLVFHQQSKVIQCPFCPYASYVSTIKLHMLKHRAVEVFDCTACEFSTNNPKSLNHHTEIYHNQIFKCEYCEPPNLSRMTKHSLIKHWDEAHGIREMLAVTTNEACAQWNNLTPSKPGSSCSMLSSEVIVKSEYAQVPEDGIMNNANAQGLTVVQPSGEFVTGGLTDDDIEQAYDCPVCEFSSPLKVLLKYHILSMHTKKFSCRHCAAMMTKHALIQHSKNAHGVHIYFDGKGLKANNHSEIPVNSLSHSANYPKSTTHPEEHEVLAKILCSDDKFICSVCKYSSSHRFYVQEHVDKLHRKKFLCNNCPAIMTKHALVEHARVKHGVTLNLRNRYLVAAKPGTYSRSVCESDSEESNKNSEEDPDPADAWSSPMTVDLSRYIVQKGRRFFCSICKYSVLYRSKLEGHVEKVHVKKYHCKHCSVIMSRYDLIEHSMAMHGISMSVKSRGLKEVREHLDETSQGMDDQGCNGTGFDNDCHETYPSLNHSYVNGGIKPGKPFACPICDFSSHNEWSLTCHMKGMHMIKYHCNHCPAIMTKYDIIRHSMREHGIEIRPRGPSGLREARGSESQGEVQNFPSPEDTMFATDHFMGHFMDNTHNHSSPNTQNGAIKTNNPFSCAICGFTARYNWLMMKHVDLFHRKKYCCPHCPALMTKHELIEHGRSTHGVTIKAKNRFLKEVAQDSGSSDPSGNMDSSDCEDSEFDPSSFCDKSTSKKACPFCEHTAPDVKLKVHIERMHTGKYNCEHCTAVMTKYDLIKHYEKEHGYDFGSRGCRGYRFKKANGFTDGQVSKEQTVPAQKGSKSVCSFCGYTSPNSFNVQVHVQNMHVIKYHCEHCSVVMSKYDLIQHYKNEHSIVIPPSNRGYKFKKVIEVNEGQGFEDEVVKTESIPGNMRGTSPYQIKNDLSTSRKSCSLCEYSTVVPKDVRTHEERMHRLKFHCDHCPVVMVKYNLLRHNKIKHGVVLPNNHRFRQAIEVRGHEAEGEMETIQSEEDCSEFGTSSFQGSYTKNNVCLFCRYVGKSRYHVQIHVERMHTRKYRCEHCTAVMTKYDLIQHYENLHGVTIQNGGRGLHFVEAIAEEVTGSGNQVPEPARPPFTEENHGTTESTNTETESCSICDFSTKKLLSLEVHMENWHKRKYVCNDCPAVMTKHEIIEHSKDVHGVIIPRLGKPSQAIKPAVQDPVEETNPDNRETGEPRQTDSGFKVDATGKAFKCDFCVFSSAHRKSTLMHVINMHRKKYSCNNCAAVLTKYELIVHSKDVHGVEIPWNFRGHVFKQVTKEGQNEESQTDKRSEVSLKSEIPEKKTECNSAILPNSDKVLGADGTNKFKCSDCEFTTSYPFNLKAHGESFHTKLFCCDKCPAIKTKYELVQHYKNEHNIVLPGNRKGFKEYRPGSGQTSTSSEPFTPMDTDRHSPIGAECGLTRTNNEESEFIHSVKGHPRSTLKPEICKEATAKKHEICYERINEQHESITVERNGDDFICTFCGWSSKHKNAVQSHLGAMHEKKYGCKDCSAVMSKYDLIQHYESIHSIVVPNLGRGHTSEFFRDSSRVDADENVIKIGGESKCSICDYSSPWKNNALLHFQSLHKKKYSCIRCSVIMTKYEMIQHYETDHGVVIENSGRGHTGRFFKEVNNISDGMDESVFADDVSDCSVQDDPSITGMNTDDNDGSMTIIQEGGEYKCSICGFSTAFKFNLKPHFECFHRKKYSCNRCSIVSTKYGIVCHYENTHRFVIPNFGKGNLAPYCKAVSDFLEDVDSSVLAEGMVETVMNDPVTTDIDGDIEDQDEAIIEESGELKCAICGHSCAQKGNLRAHVEALHTRKYSCNRCSLITTKYDMVQHYETDHGVVIGHLGRSHAYFMAVDGASEGINSSVFAGDVDERSLGSHWIAGVNDDAGRIDIIKDGEDFKCSVCGVTAAQKGNIKTHFDVLHKKKYSCNRCLVVLTKYEMIQHYVTDHKVEIEKSGKGCQSQYFTDVDLDPEANDALDESIIDSTGTDELYGADIIQGGEDFKCSACGHTAAQKGNIKTHIDVLHKKKYSCNRCSIVLTKYEMIQHYDNDHKVEIEKSGKGPKSQYFTEVDLDPDANNADDESVIDSTWANELYGADESVTIIKEGDEFKCTICCYSSSRQQNAGFHLDSHHKKKYSCNICSAIMSKYDMVKHYETDHAVVAQNQGLGDMAKYCKAVNQAPGVSNPSQAHIEPENKLLTVIGRPTTDIETDADNDIGFIFKDGREFKCSICEYSSPMKSTVEKHLESLHKKKFSCNRCLVIMTKYDMMQHFENDHGVEIPYKGRGVTIQYFTSVDGDSNVSCLGHSEPQFTRAAGSSSEIETISNVPLIEVPEMDELKCTMCNHSTKYKSNLKVHMETLHTRKFSCNCCSVIMTKHDMIQHCENEHGVVISKLTSAARLPFVEVSEVVDDLTSLADIEPTVSADSAAKTAFGSGGGSMVHSKDGKDLACYICQFSTNHGKSMEMHMVNFHKRKYACNHCQAVFTKHSLIKHCKNVHGVIISGYNRNIREVKSATKGSTNDNRSSSDSPCPSSAPLGGLSTFSCSLCDFSSKLRMHLQVHTKNMHSTKHNGTDVNSESSKEYDVSDVEAMQARNTFSCTICGFTTKAKWYLKDHMVKFHRTKYYCTHCPAVLTKHVLIKHCKNVHKVVYSSRQPLCEAKDANSTSSAAEGNLEIENYRGTSTTSDVNETSSVKSNNMLADQEITDRAQCSMCDFSTPNKWYLKEHMESFHMKTYSCSQCSAVMTKHALFKHSKERHGLILKRMGRPPSASAKVSSENHAKSKYTTMPEFKKPKRFPCAICSYSSFHPFGLKRHVKIHHTIKYPCQYCPDVMTRYELIKHCRNLHNTQSPENHSEVSKPIGDCSERTIQHSDDHTYSGAMQYSTESQVINPKFQAQLKTALKAVQSPTYQPIVALERLPIDVDDLDATFSIVDNTNASDTAMAKNPKFHDSSYHLEYC